MGLRMKFVAILRKYECRRKINESKHNRLTLAVNFVLS